MGAVHGCGIKVSGEGVKLGLMRWGTMPTTEVVSDGVVAAQNMLSLKIKIVNNADRNLNLPETSLHSIVP